MPIIRKELNELPDNSQDIFKNPILTDTSIDQIYYLVVKSRVLYIIFVMLNSRDVVLYFIIRNQIIQLSINHMNFKINLIEGNREECGYQRNEVDEISNKKEMS